VDTLLQHLEQTARRQAIPPGVDGVQIWRKHLETFLFDRPPQWHPSALALPYNSLLILRAAEWLLRQDQFDVGGGIDAARGLLTARLEREYDGSEGWLARVPRRVDRLRLLLEVHIRVHDQQVEITTSRSFGSWVDDWGRRLRALLADSPAWLVALAGQGASGQGASDQDASGRPLHNPVLGPGEPLRGPFTGNLRDYSGCARFEELGDFADPDLADLPLGRYAFRDASGHLHHGPSLYTSRFRPDDPDSRMLFNGSLVCAPQNSGKTELLLRWATAANRRGFNVFLIDVKGTLYTRLAGKLRGRVYHFSTDPDLEDCDGINFIAGLQGTTPRDGMRIRQLVESLIPGEGWTGENLYHYQNSVSWMSGLLHILLLYYHYRPLDFEGFVGGKPNLGNLFSIASNEGQLYKYLALVLQAERQAGAAAQPPGLAYWASEIALLLDPRKWPGGQRKAEYSYRTLTQPLVNPLRPFSRFGTLYTKIGGRRRGAPVPQRFFSFEELDRDDEPVTMILAAREQDLDDARSVVDLAVTRLQHFLFGRMRRRRPRPVLLLLDETRRIRGFKANEYITFAREAKAGCVIVYQSLDQIGERPQITEILENVGIQVYLGSLVGNTARYLIDSLPQRYRPTFSVNASLSASDVSRAIQTGQEQVGYFTTGELHRLPAGRWPALVYVKDHPPHKPFLVDLDKELPEVAARDIWLPEVRNEP
jgi:hypothetical protein